MKLQIAALVLCAAAMVTAQVSNIVTEVIMYVSFDDFRQCDMGTLGQVSIKLCGEKCCFKSLIGSSYEEGYEYRFSGPQLEECEGFDVGAVEQDNINIGLYHTGTDAVCFSSVAFRVDNGLSAFCSFNDTMMDNRDFIISDNCEIL